MVSGLTILRADEMDRRDWSYVTLAEHLRRVSSDPRNDAAELFRRMTFNALISNIDDHPRNHALLAKGKWRLSPAYDLTPQSPVGIDRRNLAMVCGRAGTYANIHNLLSECRRFLLGKDEAEAMVLEMADIVKNSWMSTARKVGVTVGDCDKISGAFVYPGFSYQLEAA
jgi:serine/threonine-protein kinase HipA